MEDWSGSVDLSMTRFAAVHHTGGVTSIVSHSPVALFNQIIVDDESATERYMERSLVLPVFDSRFRSGLSLTVCSLGIVDDGSISVFDVGTLEDHRGKGYGAAMTMTAVVDGRDSGCDVAFLQSSEMGYSVYKRLGFETIFTYDIWGLPPAK